MDWSPVLVPYSIGSAAFLIAAVVVGCQDGTPVEPAENSFASRSASAHSGQVN